MQVQSFVEQFVDWKWRSRFSGKIYFLVVNSVHWNIETGGKYLLGCCTDCPTKWHRPGYSGLIYFGFTWWKVPLNKHCILNTLSNLPISLHWDCYIFETLFNSISSRIPHWGIKKSEKIKLGKILVTTPKKWSLFPDI